MSLSHTPSLSDGFGLGALDVEIISSRRNAIVATFRALTGPRDDTDRRVLVDGLHLIEEAHAAGIPIAIAAFARSRLESEDQAYTRLVTALADSGTRILAVSESVMAALSPVRTPSGAVAIGRRLPMTLEDALQRRPQLIVALADIQNPGNVGAIVRAADAGGATAIVTTGMTADPFGWKALRGAMGSTFRFPVVRHENTHDLIAVARQHQLRVIATTSRGGTPIYDVDLSRPTLVLFGNEGAGLDPALAPSTDETVSIPMRSDVESLNVAVAAALVVYEAFRQRQAS